MNSTLPGVLLGSGDVGIKCRDGEEGREKSYKNITEQNND